MSSQIKKITEKHFSFWIQQDEQDDNHGMTKSNGNDNGREEGNRRTNDANAVVILPGWSLCDLRHVQKYANIYHQQRQQQNKEEIASRDDQRHHPVTPSVSTIGTKLSDIHLMSRNKHRIDEWVMASIRHAAQLLRPQEQHESQPRDDDEEGHSAVANTSDGDEKAKKDNEDITPPLIIHGFSNGGGQFIERLDLILKDYHEYHRDDEEGRGGEDTNLNDDGSETVPEKKKKKNISKDQASTVLFPLHKQQKKDIQVVIAALAKGAIIFDSSPCLTLKSAYDAIRVSLPRKIIDMPARYFAYMCLSSAIAAHRVNTFVQNKPTAQQEYGENLANMSFIRAALEVFIYSVADEICDYKTIEELAATREKKAAEIAAASSADTNTDAANGTTKVIRKRFDDSPHVQHLMKYPTEYNNFVHEQIVSNVIRSKL